MRLFFLGTAAAEGYPGIFCDCPNCNEARALGGRNLRCRSALLVNDNLIIDFGPDLLAASLRFNKNLSLATTGLVTHAHTDHFYISNFEMRKPDLTGGLEIPFMRLYGPRDVRDALDRTFPDLAAYRIDSHTVRALDTWHNDGYTFTAYQAHHAVGHLDALFYSIEDGRRSVLYATDTGLFPEATWHALAGKSFDVIILEETMGYASYSQHIGFKEFVAVANRMRAEVMLRPGGRLIAHHFSHTGNPVHQKIEAVLNPHGVEVAYDGLEINLD